MTIDDDESRRRQQQQHQQEDEDSPSQARWLSFPRPHSEQARTNGRMVPLQQKQQQQQQKSLPPHRRHDRTTADEENPYFFSNNPLVAATAATTTTTVAAIPRTTTTIGDDDLTTSLLPPSADNSNNRHNNNNTATSSSSTPTTTTTTTTTCTTNTTTTTMQRRLLVQQQQQQQHHRLSRRHRHLVRMDSSIRAIRHLGHYLAYFTLLTMLILLPIVLYNALHDRKLDLAAYNSAWVMVCGTIILSVRLVYLHLTHWYMPAVQKYVVRIVWMVPLYATQSYLSLRFHQARIYIDSVRDFYEAYVIASFVYYLMELLGGQDALVELLRHKQQQQQQAPAIAAATAAAAEMSYRNQQQQQQSSTTTITTTTTIGQHVFPLNLILEPWELGLEFTLQCKHGVLQYVVFKSIATVLTFVCESAGIYGEGKFDWFVAYPYICFLQNLSVMYALYCLVMLYQAVEQELRHPINWRPLGKFLCVKAVVFFCWWQGVLIFYLRAHGIIEGLGSWTSEEVANGLIDYCIVIEMVGFAIAHSYTFTYKEYLPSNLPPHTTAGVAEQETHSDVTALLLPSSSQQQHATAATTTTSTTILNENGNTSETTNRVAALYRPPATLPRPMKFKDAFWSSTVPKETIQDIQRLRNDFLKSTTGNSNRSNANNNDNADDDNDNNDTSTLESSSASAPAITMQDLSSSSRRNNNGNSDDKKESSQTHSFV